MLFSPVTAVTVLQFKNYQFPKVPSKILDFLRIIVELFYIYIYNIYIIYIDKYILGVGKRVLENCNTVTP